MSKSLQKPCKRENKFSTVFENHSKSFISKNFKSILFEFSRQKSTLESTQVQWPSILAQNSNIAIQEFKLISEYKNATPDNFGAKN